MWSAPSRQRTIEVGAARIRGSADRTERSWGGPVAVVLLLCVLTGTREHAPTSPSRAATVEQPAPVAVGSVHSALGEGLTQALLTRYRESFRPLLLSGTHLNAEGQLDGPDGPFYIYYTGAAPDPSFLGPYAGLVGWTVRLVPGVR
jgi:hypothetical protein